MIYSGSSCSVFQQINNDCHVFLSKLEQRCVFQNGSGVALLSENHENLPDFVVPFDSFLQKRIVIEEGPIEMGCFDFLFNLGF